MNYKPVRGIIVSVLPQGRTTTIAVQPPEKSDAPWPQHIIFQQHNFDRIVRARGGIERVLGQEVRIDPGADGPVVTFKKGPTLHYTP